MSGTFVLMDLPSQALAVERVLRGQTPEAKLAWLGAHGKLWPMHKYNPRWPDTYFFESYLGLMCGFFFNEDKIVFLGDNTTYTVEDKEY